jgi:hypothetical protein
MVPDSACAGKALKALLSKDDLLVRIKALRVDLLATFMCKVIQAPLPEI